MSWIQTTHCLKSPWKPFLVALFISFRLDESATRGKLIATMRSARSLSKMYKFKLKEHVGPSRRQSKGNRRDSGVIDNDRPIITIVQ